MLARASERDQGFFHLPLGLRIESTKHAKTYWLSPPGGSKLTCRGGSNSEANGVAGPERGIQVGVKGERQRVAVSSIREERATGISIGVFLRPIIAEGVHLEGRWQDREVTTDASSISSVETLRNLRTALGSGSSIMLIVQRLARQSLTLKL